ncbi:MAG: NEW3 domain-containing protein [Haloarculaceae archaeon]
MRRSHAIALAGLLLVGTFVAASPAGATHGESVTVNGTVTGTDGAPAGDAVVLVGEDSALTAFSPDELRDLATDPPQNLTAVEVGRDGRFEATLGSLRAEAAVAVSDAGVSDLAYVRGENATLSLRLHERRPQTVHAHLGAVTADERRAELYVNLGNSGDATVENLSVSIGSLPDGWAVDDVATNGTYHPDNRTLTWPSVAPGAEVDTTVVLTVPEGTATGEYTVELRAESDTHLVDVAPETVEVLPEDTPAPRTTPAPSDEEPRTSSSPGDEESRTTNANETPLTPTRSTDSAAGGDGTRSTDSAAGGDGTRSPTEGGERPRTPTGGTGGSASPANASGPGFGTVAAAVAVALAAALFVRRR